MRVGMEHEMALREVAGDGFVLEPQVAAHAEEMFVVLADPAIYEYENDPPRSIEWLRERYARLESRRSSDGTQGWLNWVIRLPDGRLAGYVQATVYPDRHAAIAYELASVHWGRGLGRRAVEAMIAELVQAHDVRSLSAVLKAANRRSFHLLERLGFSLVDEPCGGGLEPDEIRMRRDA